MKPLHTVGTTDYNGIQLVRSIISYVDGILYIRNYLNEKVIYKFKVDGFQSLDISGEEDWFDDLLVLYYDKVCAINWKDLGAAVWIKQGKVEFVP